MVKNKPPSKDITRKDNERFRRMEINRGIDRVGSLVPYLNFVSSFTGQKVKPTKNDILRLTSAFVSVATSEKSMGYLQNRDPSSEKLIELLNQVRSEKNCSFFFCDGSTKILFAHDGVFEKLGYDATDVIGHKIDEYLLPPDELDDFRANLLYVKHKLISKGVQQQNFEFTCHMQHQKKQRNKSTTTQHRSRVIFFGNMFLSKVSTPSRKQIAKQGNGHITVKELDTLKNNFSKDPFFFFGQIEIIPDELFRQTVLTVEKNEYVLFMNTSGCIYYVDQRVVKVLGHFPLDLKDKFAHDFIADETDLRLALVAHLRLLKRPTDVGETVHRLRDCTGNSVFVKSFGVLYQEKGETIFKLTAIKISEAEGEDKLNQEFNDLPEEVKELSITELQTQVYELAQKFNKKSLDVHYIHDPSQEQSNDAHLTSSSLGSEFEANSGNLVSNSSNNYQTPLNQSSSLLTIAQQQQQQQQQQQLLINSLNQNHLQHGQLNNNRLLQDNNQNLTQTAPVTVANSMVYRYIPVTSVIANQTIFNPNQQQQIFNLPSPVPSTPQLVNNDHVFIQNINININNNNFIMYNNHNQQNFNVDHHLPTEGEGAFVNLIPFLEHDIDHNDINPTK